MRFSSSKILERAKSINSLFVIFFGAVDFTDFCFFPKFSKAFFAFLRAFFSAFSDFFAAFFAAFFTDFTASFEDCFTVGISPTSEVTILSDFLLFIVGLADRIIFRDRASLPIMTLASIRIHVNPG